MLYRIDTEQLEEAERRLADFIDHCVDQLARVEEIVKSTPVRWDSIAARAYADRHQSWVSSAQDMAVHLRAVHERATTARNAYQAAAAANLRMFG